MAKNHSEVRSADETITCDFCRGKASDAFEWTAEKPLPIYADRRTCAAIVTHFFFPVMPRTIATWPLVAKRPNRTVVYEVDELMAYAAKRLNEAYSYRQA